MTSLLAGTASYDHVAVAPYLRHKAYPFEHLHSQLLSILSFAAQMLIVPASQGRQSILLAFFHIRITLNL